MIELIRVSRDESKIVNELFPAFKLHLRVLHDIEDDEIKMYLGAAIGQIEHIGSNDIHPCVYKVIYTTPSDGRFEKRRWYCGKQFISEPLVVNSAGMDVTDRYIVDLEQGIFYPSPVGNEITFRAGYLSADDIPDNVKNIIFRLGADFYENREMNRVGEPKTLPGWLQYSVASIWKPRI
jgi:hypothetical protein